LSFLPPIVYLLAVNSECILKQLNPDDLCQPETFEKCSIFFPVDTIFRTAFNGFLNFRLRVRRHLDYFNVTGTAKFKNRRAYLDAPAAQITSTQINNRNFHRLVWNIITARFA